MKILLLIRKENTEEANKCYQMAIEKFGGEVVLLYDFESVDSARKILETVDGILLPGGDDVGVLDFFLIEYALKNRLRLLGICQGMQSMALYHTSNSLVSIGNLSHQQEEGYVHSVTLEDGRLKMIVGRKKIFVNSHHVQTVLESPCFAIVGKSEDGLIEAIENSEHFFQIGVQWHPERMLEYDRVSNLLFQEFLHSF